MGKLPKLSKESAERVNSSLLEMKNAIDTISSGIKRIGEYSENQAASNEKIS
jgi:methyl-accepting chemotaxis protein